VSGSSHRERSQGVQALAENLLVLAVATASPSAWTFGWEALVAIGTIGLAVGTFLTARRTKTLAEKTEGIASETERLADETRALAELQSRAQQAAVKPTLMPPEGERALDIAGDQTHLALHLRNVGSGLALLHTTRMLRTRGADGLDEYGGTLTSTVIPVGETAIAQFRFVGQEQRFAEFTQGSFWIEVTYSDAVEEQKETALFHVEKVAFLNDQLRVVRVQLKRDGEDEPYASSGYGAVR
jgi:hypothetical protein